MARRLRKTLIDYLVIAISPALIMTLVGSLVFFLIQVFYRGNFQGRLEYIFALFVFASVLIGRISIEEGKERAILFAVPLAIAIMLTANRFVQFQGGLEQLSFIINFGLIALVWWSAYKLTWDCTLIDEDQEDTGEGLLEAVGLDRSDKTALQSEIAPATPEPEATTSRDERPLGWWKRFAQRRHRPHAPGVWVVYFSLAALPLFGVGQLFIDAANLSDRQYTFQLLCVYTASGLGLLLTTSFLGLRRYLRQRGQEMPFLMINFWLFIGGILIAGVMLAAMMLPRPNAEYTLADLPLRIGSPDQKPSSFGTGREGVADKQPSAGNGQVKEKQIGSNSSEKQSDAKSDKGSDQDRRDREERKDTKPSKTDRESNKNTAGNSRSAEKESSNSAKGQRQDENRGTNGAPKTPTVPRPVSMPNLSGLANLITWIFYGVLALAAIIAIWRHRRDVLDFFLNFGQWLRNLFGGIVHRSGDEEEKENIQRAQSRRFADFIDPFATGAAGSYTPEDLVRYTFEALEAWARDHGCPRQPDQTPHEFARGLASHVSALTGTTITLADLYCQVAYAPGTLPAASVGCLSQLWRNLRAEVDKTNLETIRKQSF